MKCALLAVVAGVTLALPWKLSDLQDVLTLQQSSPLDMADKQVVSSQEIQKHINKAQLQERANKLLEIAETSEHEFGHPTRVIGSDGHNATLEYILSELESFGGDYYDVSTQDLPASFGRVDDFQLTVAERNISNSTVFAMSPPTPHKQVVTAPLVLVGELGCSSSNYGYDVSGSIALVSRGECPFGDKSKLAGEAGALAVIIYNNVPGEGVIHGTLGTPDSHHVPTIGINNEDGTEFVKEIEGGNYNLKASVRVDSYVKSIVTKNVIAQTKTGDVNNVVMLGAHSDSVAEGPGINDDGSGTISLLEVAKALTSYGVNNAVRFAWWAAEEEGLVGSDYYANHLSPEENQKVRLFMDYDMMASPNYAYQVYNGDNINSPPGSGELRQLYIDFYEDLGLNYTLVPFDGRSDYDGFIKNGIPGGGVATGAEGLKTPQEQDQFGGKSGIAFDPCYHQLCDNLSNVDYEAWVINTKLIAHSVAVYGKSLEGFPKRTGNKLALAAADASASSYHGPSLVL